jgi:O-antigen/teichoic acid export membrane protein
VPLLLVAPTLVPKVITAFARPALAPVARLLVGEGKWQTLRYGVTALHASARPWLIQAVLGPQAVAVFDAAKTATGASLDLLPLKEALVPMMSEEAHRPARLRTLYVDSIRCGIWLFGAMGLGIALIAPVVFRVVFPQYEDAIPVTQVLALAFLTSGFGTPQGAVMYALRMQPTYLSTTLLNFACLFALGIPLMIVWGPAGMAAALVASGVLIAVLRQKAIERLHPELRISWREWLWWSASDWLFLKTLLVRRTRAHESDDAGLPPVDAEGVNAG